MKTSASSEFRLVNHADADIVSFRVEALGGADDAVERDPNVTDRLRHAHVLRPGQQLAIRANGDVERCQLTITFANRDEITFRQQPSKGASRRPGNRSLGVTGPAADGYVVIQRTDLELNTYSVFSVGLADQWATVQPHASLKTPVPICSCCKSIRDEHDHWERIESYLYEHVGIHFSHGYCPGCYRRFVEPQLAALEAWRAHARQDRVAW